MLIAIKELGLMALMALWLIAGIAATVYGTFADDMMPAFIILGGGLIIDWLIGGKKK